MSYTTIDVAIRVQVWMRAGGRCEYRGCNEPLWKDNVTLRRMNKAYLAHIVADIPGGPRGDAVLSGQLKSDFSNIMLLCDTHHRLIDREGLDEHPVDRLREFKTEHEERIEKLTAIHPNRKTEIVTFGLRIDDRISLPTPDQARIAVAPERYPTSQHGISIDLSGNGMSEADPEYWNWASRLLDRRISIHLAEGVGPTGQAIDHVSIFALAPIPLLIYFGNRWGDTIPVEVHQRNRNPGDWKWREMVDDDFSYISDFPGLEDPPVQDIALRISLSGSVSVDEVRAELEDHVPIYTIAIDDPRRDFLRAREQLELFQAEWGRFLARVRQVHGGNTLIHVFPAIPNSVAVVMGLSRLPKVDPAMLVYDYHQRQGGWNPRLRID